MIDFESHKVKLEKALSVSNPLTRKNCVDMIDEKLWWENVIPVLNDISLNAADELQEETRKPYPKDTKLIFSDAEGHIVHVKSVEEFKRLTENIDPYDSILEDESGNLVGVRRNQKYSEQPPTRLLSMTLNLCYFIGFLEVDKVHQMDEENGISAWKRIVKAYEMGKASHPKSKSGLANAKTAATS
jgi:hypothetical protein